MASLEAVGSIPITCSSCCMMKVMGNGLLFHGPGKRFEMVLEAFEGRTYKVPLVRGPLWPDGDDPPLHARELTAGLLETAQGNFSSIDQLAQHFGCVIDYNEVQSIDDN